MPNIIRLGNTSAKKLNLSAGVNDVLSGKTFSIDGKSSLTGTMVNRGAVNQTLAVNGSYIIPQGYHNGTGKVTQAIPTLGAATYTPGTSNKTIASGQYLTGNQTIKGDSNLLPANIVSGKSIFGVNGSAIGLSMRRYTTVAAPNTGSYWSSGTRTFYWKSDQSSVDYTKSIVIINGGADYDSAPKIIDTSNGTATAETRVQLGNSKHKIKFTTNGYQIIGEGNAGVASPAIMVQLIMFDNCKSIQVVNGSVTPTTELVHTTGDNYETYACYCKIESVDSTKAILFHEGSSVGGDSGDYSHKIVPLLYSDTQVLWVMALRTTAPTSINMSFAVVEFN